MPLKVMNSAWDTEFEMCMQLLERNVIMVTGVLLPKLLFSFRLVAAPEPTADLTIVCGPAVRALPSHSSGTSSVTASKGSF